MWKPDPSRTAGDPAQGGTGSRGAIAVQNMDTATTRPMIHLPATTRQWGDRSYAALSRVIEFKLLECSHLY